MSRIPRHSKSAFVWGFMKRFRFYSFGYYFMQIGVFLIIALCVGIMVFAIIQREIAIAVLAAVVTVVLSACFIWSFIAGSLVVTEDYVRVYAPAYIPKRFEFDKIRVIFIEFKKHKKRRWYEAYVEVQLLNGKKLRFSFYHTNPRGGSFCTISPKRKAKLEALAADCKKITCKTME